MAGPNFEPWKPPGDDPRFNSVRLLILGESHYDDGETYPPEVQKEFTRDIVKRWGSEAEGYQRFFANVFRTFNDGDGHHTSDDFREFWGKVFFYNYVQELVPGGARVRPSSQAWATSVDAFHSVLDDVKPEAVVVVGRTTWKMMSEREATQVADDPDGLGAVWRYHFDGGDCFVAHTHHPSKTGYSAAEWRRKTKRFLEWVGSVRSVEI